jgi:hypothetical protein
VPVSASFAGSPLATTVEQLHTIEPEMNAVHLGAPDAPGWNRCSDLIEHPELLREWQDALTRFLLGAYHCTQAAAASAAAACTLDAYTFPVGFLAGAAFHVDRRVPHVAPDVVAFSVDPDEHWVSGVALLDDRFWCLPDDPASDHRSATVVASEVELARVARHQVHEHAEAFLATYDPGVRLAVSSWRSAFADSLDSAPWIAQALAAPTDCLTTSAALLPGAVADFPEVSCLYVLTDGAGRTHVTRRRSFCCKSHLLEPDGSACMDCVRTSDATRVEIATGLPEPPPFRPSDGGPP